MANKQRKVWFITRPERDPKFHLDALEALKEATNEFKEKWQGNREMHLKYEKALNRIGLKRANVSRDGSGGRTWVAMLKTFSYVYTDEEGYLKLTRVGESLLTGDKTKNRENISKQILTLQIPNAYFLSSGFSPKFEDGFEIHPARFLVQLANQSQLDYYVTKEEITFFALKAKKNSDLHDVVEQIRKFRGSSEKQQQDMKKEIATEYDHRERSDKGARDFEEAHNDVAHTFMLLCDYTELVEYVRGKFIHVPDDKRENTSTKINEYEKRYPFSKRYMISLERFSEHAGLDVDRYKSNPFGNVSPATNSSKSQRRVRMLLTEYPNIGEMSKDKIVRILNEYFSKKESEKYAELLTKEDYSSLNEDFVEGYLNEKNDLTFEDKTAAVLEAIGFKVDLRPRPTVKGEKTIIEILIHLDEENICILDAKNHGTKFPLAANLASHMASEYIPIYHGYQGKKVHSFGYITSANKWSGESNLSKITKKVRGQTTFEDTDIKGAIISANALLGFLDYCLENNVPIEERKRWFTSLFINRGYSSFSQMEKFK
ncbi:AlwI family type II restriction endonuclease [Pontibacillus yanchengensis]|uniref:Restriction endonuclease AlwI n=1 Tax=Pontibacillus yanchengensis Y32 TaxID=1385514 RepID=A0A0A2TGY9_9BACI|nr:AlwI family type II restriction endonuclease [Pontibacillus yanchengensis]KGP73723.1 restriction endonuclease AlwI [Pontibacillus yanchengensis Y32]